MQARTWLALGVSLSIAACNTPATTTDAASASDAGPAMCAAPGTPTTGAADTHCAPSTVQATAQASCFGDVDTGPDDVDAGVEECEYGDTLFGMSGDDDDCKYHVSWTSTPICEGSAGVFFTVVATNKTDGSPVTGANMRAETFVTSAGACDATTSHPGPNTFAHFAEGPPGTYSGAIQFDQAGQWSVRFHLFEECSDAPEDSPHGHVAFRLTVP